MVRKPRSKPDGAPSLFGRMEFWSLLVSLFALIVTGVRAFFASPFIYTWYYHPALTAEYVKEGIKIENEGNAAAHTVKVTAVMPAQTKFTLSPIMGLRIARK